MSDHHNADFVGPIIGLGEIADAAAEAVYIDNPGREVRIEKIRVMYEWKRAASAR